MSAVRVLCLGNPHASDDGAAFVAADALGDRPVVRAGRPGPGLLDLLEGDAPVVLLDATRTGAPPGTVHRLDLAALADASVAQPNVSSHGFGPAETLQLGHALGRPLPRGTFVGLEGERFEPGSALSPAVRAALPRFVEIARQAIVELE